LALSKHLLSREDNIPTAEYPGTEWNCILSADAGFDSDRLAGAKQWLDKRLGNGRYRVVIVRSGRVVVEWYRGFHPKKLFILSTSIKTLFLQILGRNVDSFSSDKSETFARNRKLQLASATKSIFSCILGIAICEGKIPSADAKIVDFYPEAMQIAEGEGPKPGRHSFEKDREITFRQLISNTSGYMKPGEKPGMKFHYQTYGMNILTHAIAKTYGLYDIQNPDTSPGFKQLVDVKLRIPINAVWSYYMMNFNLHPKARINIFGCFDGVKANALDMARLGWLWCNRGRWKEKQIVPEYWMREATRTAPDIIANCPKEQWKYGYGFWTNDYSQIWPDLPRDSFAASGAGGQHIWVCPSLDLVVVQSPGVSNNKSVKYTEFLRLILNACA
jgi:CubicO group peptidase (beta-lactamase class C family)